MRSWCLVVMVATQSFLVTNAVGDESVNAREHYRRGTNAFNLGHYLDAVKEYEAAYQQKEDPALLFNIAQAYRLAGENESALRVYKSFLHQVPDSPQRPDVEKRISELQALVDQQRKTKEAPPEGTIAPKPIVASEPTTPPSAVVSAPQPAHADVRAPWYRDTVAMTLAAVGVASLGAGVGLAVKGNLDLSHANTAADLQDHDSLRSSGITFSAAGYAALGVGAALCIGATVKWAVRPKRRPVVVGLGASATTASVLATGSF
jgi:tetratricopeptide (TPR) repeat protein